MRGKARQAVYKDIKHGITPAYAGKSGVLVNVDEVAGDHPRVCGEKIVVISTFYPLMGSPPRMRGKD